MVFEKEPAALDCEEAVLPSAAVRQADSNGEAMSVQKILTCPVKSVFVVLMVAVACSSCEVGSVENIADAEKRDWQLMPDQSYAWTNVISADGPVLFRSERCWPEHQGFTCVGLDSPADTGSTVVRRFNRASMQSGAEPMGTDGYSCLILIAPAGMSIQERISKGTRDLIRNTKDWYSSGLESGELWTKDRVDSFLVDNRIEGSGWVNCATVLAMLQSGSESMLVTTEVNRDDLLEES